MPAPSPDGLLDAVRALPDASPLLAALPEEPLYLVGGAVRDLLLGRAPRELDLLTEGDPATVASRLGGDVKAYDRFGTCTVALDGRSYDIARARTERYPRPGALPDVTPATVSEDLPRRDFSVNAIALGLHDGALVSVPGAVDDVHAGLLRVLHDRSFIDDPTRLLRLARYAARLGFEVEPGTRALARSAVAAGALATVSGPRVGNELRLLAREEDPVGGLVMLAGLEVSPSVADRDVVDRALRLLPRDGRRDLLVLGMGFREGGAQGLAGLGFVASDRDVIASVAGDAEALAARLRAAGRPSEIARAVGGRGVEVVAAAGALGAEAPAREWLERLRHVRLEITGEDLLRAGIAPGPAIGAGLRAALEEKLDGYAPDRATELGVALHQARA
jgi:tRNA nucleotidyltransferase (CCA-adding enzyme)